MILKRASKKAVVYAPKNFHYSKKTPALTGTAYSVFNNNNEWCGCIIYGSGGNPYLGKKYGLNGGEVFELTRMALNGKQESTSKALSISLKLIKKDCPTLKMIVSYADKGQRHKGVIYQATNWIFVEESISSSTEFYWKGKWIHSRSMGQIARKYNYNLKSIKSRKASGKYKYLYPLNKKIRKELQKVSKPYPKKLSIDGVKVTHNISNIEKAGQYRPQCSN